MLYYPNQQYCDGLSQAVAYLGSIPAIRKLPCKLFGGMNRNCMA